MPRLRIIEEVISRAELDAEFQKASVFVCPTHTTPAMVMIDAMSHGLPIVTTDVWANREMVTERNGILIPPAMEVKYADELDIPVWGSSEFGKAIRKTHHDVADSIIDAVEQLYANRKLAIEKGLNGWRLTAENGPFSLERRNRELKEVFDTSFG